MKQKSSHGGWGTRLSGLASVIPVCAGTLNFHAAAPIPDRDAQEMAVEAYIFVYPLATMEMPRPVMTTAE